MDGREGQRNRCGLQAYYASNLDEPLPICRYQKSESERHLQGHQKVEDMRRRALVRRALVPSVATGTKTNRNAASERHAKARDCTDAIDKQPGQRTSSHTNGTANADLPPG